MNNHSRRLPHRAVAAFCLLGAVVGGIAHAAEDVVRTFRFPQPSR